LSVDKFTRGIYLYTPLSERIEELHLKKEKDKREERKYTMKENVMSNGMKSLKARKADPKYS